MVDSSTRIAIIGGGMGGLTAAIALTRIAGVHVTVFEQASRLGEVGAGVTVAPNAARVLDRLGVLERVRGSGAVPDGHGVYLDAMGNMVTDAAWEDSARQYQNIGMYRPDLIDALAHDVDPQSIRLGHRLKSVEKLESVCGWSSRTGPRTSSTRSSAPTASTPSSGAPWVSIPNPSTRATSSTAESWTRRACRPTGR